MAPRAGLLGPAAAVAAAAPCSARARLPRFALLASAAVSALLAAGAFCGLGWALPPAGAAAAGRQAARGGAPVSLAGPPALRQLAGVARHAKIGGQYGVLPETDAPIIDTSHEEDPLLERLVTVVQAADGRRGVDITAFWIHQGYEIIVIITALSRPQLQAIANDIEQKMRKKLRLKRTRNVYFTGHGIRQEAATGWVCMAYPRITTHVMTPTQRSYYDIESTWRDDNQDYERIPVDELIREDGFGNLRLTRELGQDSSGYAVEDEEEDEPGVNVGSGIDYEEDEEDPFWS